MNSKKLILVIFAVALALFLMVPNLSWAEDGAALYKTKCAACHGPDGAGKPAIKAPSLISPEAKKLTDAELTDAIANGGKEQKPTHAFAKKGLSPEQVTTLVAYIRTIQK
ncbi:MAG: cytochrome c [Acidobacteria bacterium]|nr:cytochrome c [Acidobacteriota bacterium]